MNTLLNTRNVELCIRMSKLIPEEISPKRKSFAMS